MNDKELLPWLEQAKLGDESAFQLVYQATHQDVYRTVAFLVYNKQDIEDIVNEVYMRMWRSMDKYDPNRPFRFWLHGITVRLVQDWKRKAWRRIRLFERNRQTTCEPFDWTDNAVLRSETQHELFSLVRQLSYKLRVVVILRYFHDYALEEIADMLQIPVGTVKSRHHLALKELRKRFEMTGGDAYVH
ncbi:RNA polymerase sigma factor [Paenibacillus vortex V453]|jgi:RNA polymerase sigma-70 factor, ECF subfamily|uniref:RNA polymerase subunit sigma n=2 Tax=Paenibacillus TaxID=44249 RepID=A0A163INF4_9BACL|nr:MULTISPECIES: sigma-70 family RNA polymerase sigma factor [Paenibacillus]AWP30488.1 RNA polymerase subunit sigma [Paenibacillus sp. Cedars]EFU43737.1 RNA polymerase sigma factor [Paenibacillus vortex V453]KZS46052.1 RNA polymerase subunit sigma [Paenibacillus glucanolyticus]MDH6673807.1 RNA polymerase sigma-70 factor (ECF subfamily) [Paenibacillus sp. LBL]MPY19242.1 sigma-70 family RNA polymerase sigma factor [Paenibacillus glucanolyticus]